jgi:hypothetical protein
MPSAEFVRRDPFVIVWRTDWCCVRLDVEPDRSAVTELLVAGYLMQSGI